MCPGEVGAEAVGEPCLELGIVTTCVPSALGWDFGEQVEAMDLCESFFPASERWLSGQS